MMRASKVKLDAKITFVPAVTAGEMEVVDASGRKAHRSVSGKIVYINRPHRWFTVEYPAGNTVLREGMKFIPD